MEIIRTYDKGTEEYKRLEKAAELLTSISPNNLHYYVKDTFFDYGMDWRWTTICCREKGTQVLSPRDFKNIITYDSLYPAVYEIISNERWFDTDV